MKRVALILVVLFLAAGMMITGCARKPAEKPEAAKLERIHFDFDKSNIKPEWEDELRGNAQWSQSNPNKDMVIEGHCDERGSLEYNIALGDRRANSARRYLQNLGVPSDRMSTISYGEERPMCQEHHEGCWWQNRRAEFKSR